MNFLPANYDLETSWEKIETPLKHPAFTTHLNYASYLKNLSDNLKLKVKVKQLSQINKSDFLEKKVKLIRLIEENINEEYKKICNFKDYSQICVSWIPVKSYYLFFNLVLLLLYLIEGQEKWFIAHHDKIHIKLKEIIRENKLIFSKEDFNKIYLSRQILTWAKTPPGSNIRTTNQDATQLKKLIIQKLLDYKKQYFKQQRNIKRLCEPKKTQFLNKTTISLWEFFYWYRIKVNYRDMTFIESSVSIEEFYEFYRNYYFLTKNFFKALKPTLNILAMQRIGENIL